MDEEIVKGIYKIRIKLMDAYKKIEEDSKHNFFEGYQIDNFLIFLEKTISNINTIIHTVNKISNSDIIDISNALDIIEQYNSKNLSDDEKKEMIIFNSFNLGLTQQLNHNVLYYPNNYEENYKIITEYSSQIQIVINTRKKYLKEIKLFNQFLRKISYNKLNITVNLDYDEIMNDNINKIFDIELIKNCFLCYLHELSNIYLYNIYNELNLKNKLPLPFLEFDNKEDYKNEINKIIDNIIKYIKENEIKVLKKETLNQLTQTYSILEFMGINFENDIDYCNTKEDLINLTKKYIRFINNTTIIFYWTNNLDNNINSVMNHIKEINQEKGIIYINNNYQVIIEDYLIKYIKTLLNQKFNIELNNNNISIIIKHVIESYDNTDSNYIKEKTNLVVKETIKSLLKEKIDKYPKKLFQSYYSILSAFDHNYDELYEQIYNEELNIEKFIKSILETDKKYKTLKKDLDEEIELVKIYWESDTSEMKDEFTSFMNDLLKKYNDNYTKKWILNYLKVRIAALKLGDDIENLLTFTDDLDTTINNDNNKNKSDETPDISYLIFDDDIYNIIIKNKFNSNNEKEKYLSNLREYINYLLSCKYKANNNKFILSKYKSTKNCWKLKKCNNDMLIRMSIGFEKDNIIIGSIFKRPTKEKLYNQYISDSNDKINNIIKSMQYNDNNQNLYFVYENILILENIYAYFHTNISSLTNDDINYDYKLLLQIVLKFKNELKNVNYNILSLLEINELDKINQNISNIEDELKNKILIKK